MASFRSGRGAFPFRVATNPGRCRAGDGELRRELESLLEYDAQASVWLDLLAVVRSSLSYVVFTGLVRFLMVAVLFQAADGAGVARRGQGELGFCSATA